MTFWLIAAGMTVVAVALLVRPLLTRRAAGPQPAEFDLAVYRDQLAEIERDRKRGLLGDSEAAAARLEIERRVLAAAGRRETEAAGSSPPSRIVAPILIAGVPLAALSLYLLLGAPGLPSSPFAGQPRPAAMLAETDGAPPLEALVDQLARRLAQAPEDANGWLLLGRSYATLGRFQESAGAYAQAIEHGAIGAEVYALQGEALAAAADGQVTGPALDAFAAALAADPAEPRARFYKALAREQAGQPGEALDLWVKLEAEAPPDAPWRPAVTAQIESAAAALGLDPATLPGRAAPPTASAAPGPTAEDMQAAAAMSPAEREAFIRGMVERLAARLQSVPDDLEGWVRLAGARRVLGDLEAALEAWARAAALAPERIDMQIEYGQALLDAQGPGEPLAPEFAETVARIRTLEPQNRIGLFFAGVAELEAGRPDAAHALWQELLAQLPEGSPERAELQRRLDAFRAGG